MAKKSAVGMGNSKESIEDKELEIQCADDEECKPEAEEIPGDPVLVVGNVVVENESDKVEVEEKPNKCWGDYSDSEAEVVEVTS